MVKETKDLVLYHLVNYPETRDSDSLLISMIWESRNTTLYTAEFFKLFREGKLINPESIRRSRQKWQEERPDLRGKNYKERKAKEIEVIEEVRTFLNFDQKSLFS
jgi:hypothetical protein